MPRNGNRGSGLLLHPDAGGAGVVLEDVLDVAGPVAAAGGNAVEPLGVAAGKVVELERVITGDLELVADSTGLHRVERRLDRLQVLPGQLEALIPESVLAGSDLLALRPATDAILLSEPSFDHLVDGRRRARHVRVAHGGVGDDHLVAAIGVGEVVVNPFFLHDPAGEVEVGLTVLNAVVAWFVGPLELVFDARAGEHLLEDVGHCDLLEDPALGLAGQKPELGDNLREIAGEEALPMGEGTCWPWLNLLTMPLR